MKHQDVLDQFARETARARLRLTLERGVRAGSWFALALAAWATLALSGLYDLAPPLAQSLAAIAALTAFAALFWRALAAFAAPTEIEARTRLAADSRFESGAFDNLQDQPTRYDAVSAALWARERDSALARASQARAGAFAAP